MYMKLQLCGTAAAVEVIRQLLGILSLDTWSPVPQFRHAFRAVSIDMRTYMLKGRAAWVYFELSSHAMHLSAPLNR